MDDDIKDLIRDAEGGNARAQFVLGVCYADGDGVESSMKKAEEWWRKSAEGGFSSAFHNLGLMHLRGAGVSRDPKAAAEWFRRGAERGNKLSKGMLAAMYLSGVGVPQDRKEAYVWLSLAGDIGSPQFVRSVTDILPPKELEDAQAELQRRSAAATLAPAGGLAAAH